MKIEFSYARNKNSHGIRVLYAELPASIKKSVNFSRRLVNLFVGIL